MATKSLDGYKLSVVLDASGSSKGIAALKDTDKAATSADSSLNKLAKTGTRSFGDLKKAATDNAQKTQQALATALLAGKKNVGGLIGEAKKAQAEFKELEKAEQKALRLTSGGGFKAMFGGGGGGGGLFGGIGEGLKMLPGIGLIAGQLGNVVSVVQGGAKVGFDFRRTMEEGQIALEVLLKDGAKAKQLLKDLDRMSPDSPFDFGELVEATPRLLAFQFRMEEITRVMTAAGDASRGNKEAFDGITLALGQIRTKGKTNLEELLQLVERGVPVFKYLGDEVAKVDKKFAKLTGDKRDTAVQKMIERGAISSRGAVEAILRGIEGEFGGLSKRVANETASGLESQTRDNAGRLLGTGATRAFEGYKDFLRSLNTTLGSDTMRGVVERADGVIGAGINIGKGLVKGLTGAGAEAAGQFMGDFEGPKGTDAHSPARAFIPIGKRAAQGFALGFSQEISAGGAMAMFQTGGGRVVSRQVSAYDALIEEAARQYGVDPNLIRAMMQQESGGRRGAVSPKGARGPMQLMPGTAARYGVTDPHDPRQSIFGGTHYMADLLKMFGGDVRLALAGYNAGEGAVKKYKNNIPPYRETQNYVASITSIYGRLSSSTDDLAAAVRDLAASTNWRLRGDPEPNAGRVRLSDLDARQQLNLLMGIPGFRETYKKYYGVAEGGDLTGGTGTFAPEKLYPRDLSGLSDLINRQAQGVEPVQIPYIADLVLLPGELRELGTAVKSTHEPIEGLIQRVSRMDKVMNAVGQLAGLLPQQQVGKKRGFFSKLLGGVAPFLSFIPGVGPILSQVAGMASSALAGDWGGVLTQGVAGFSQGGVFRRSGSGGSGSTGGVGSAAGGTILSNLPGRASGGPVKRGRAYIVGEHRWEVFEPEEDGYIHPSGESYARSRGGAQFGRHGNRGIGALLTRLEEHFARLSSVPMDQVFTYGAKRNPGAVTDAFMTHGARDPKVVEWMGRRVAA